MLVLSKGIHSTLLWHQLGPSFFSKARWIDDTRSRAKANTFALNFLKFRGNYGQHPQSRSGWISLDANLGIYFLAFFFVSTFEASASPLNLESIWQTRYGILSCCLIKWRTKILISIKLFSLEKRMDFVLPELALQ